MIFPSLSDQHLHCALFTLSHHMTSALNVWTEGSQSLPIKHWPDRMAEFKLMGHLHQCHLSPQLWKNKVEVPRASWKAQKASRRELSIQPFYWPRHTPTAKEWSSCFLIRCPVPDNRKKKNYSSSIKRSQWDMLKRQMTAVDLRYERAPRYKSAYAAPWCSMSTPDKWSQPPVFNYLLNE